MTGFNLCKWIGPAEYRLVRYCNLMARPNDDLCATHRGVMDAELRIFDHWRKGLAA